MVKNSGAFQKFGRDVSQSSQALRGFQHILSGLLLAGFTKQLVNAGFQLDRINNSLLAVTGSTRAAQKEFEFVKDISNRLGLGLAVTAQEYSKFLAAVKSSNLSLAEGRDIFQSFSEVASVFRLSSESTGRVFSALQQIISKGTVSMEELRLQLGDHLPGALAIAAKSVGLTAEEFVKLVSNGQIVASDFLPKFAAEYKKQIERGLDAATSSTQARLNRLKNAFFVATAEFANGGFNEGIARGLEKFTNVLNNPETLKNIQILGSRIGEITGYIIQNADVVASLAGGYVLWRLALVPVISLGANLVTTLAAMRAGTYATATGFNVLRRAMNLALPLGLGLALEALSTFAFQQMLPQLVQINLRKNRISCYKNLNNKLILKNKQVLI